MRFNENGYTVFESEVANKYYYPSDVVGNLSFATMHYLSKIYESGVDTFYASDFGLNGGTMNALTTIKFFDKAEGVTRYGFLPTGNTKSAMVEIGENLYKKVDVSEWKINREVIKDYFDLYREAVKFALGE